MSDIELLYRLFSITGMSWGWIAFFFYLSIFIFFAIITTFQMVIGTLAVLMKFRQIAVEDVYSIIRSNSSPAITFIIPAYNESKVITYTVKNLLSLSYRYKKIIIINDGSTDDTLELLKTNFFLKTVPPSSPKELPCGKIRSYYISTKYPELSVIDKENGGKADALNAAINACETELFVAADADTIVDSEGLNRLIRPFLYDPDTVIAHASIGILNGSKIEKNRITEFIFPTKWLPGVQTLDFMKSFLIERMGLSWTKGALVVPGNFGLFKKDIVLELGGYNTTSLTEDTEIITHMHEYLLAKKRRYKITYIPDLVAYTQAPETIKDLVKQRLRWYMGTTENIWNYRHMWFNPKYRSIGLYVCPMTVFEKIAPLIEISGFVILFLAAWFTSVNFSLVLLLVFLSWAYGMLLVFFTLFIEAIAYQLYSTWKDLAHMLKCTFFYTAYHYILLWCRIRGLYVPKTKKVGWEPVRQEYKEISKG